VYEEEKKLTKKQAKARTDFIDIQLPIRPYSVDWEDVAFCDKFYFGIRPQLTKRIKRKAGKKWRYKPYNVHRKEITLKDIKVKAKEEDYFKLLNVFVVIGLNYKRVILYKILNSVGKITTTVYTRFILLTIKEDLKREDLTLC
jgi:hypothetical protein